MIGSKLIALRNEHQMTQKDFAERTGISYGTLQAYEYGTQSPRYDYLTKVSDIFNVPMMFFLDDDTPSGNSYTAPTGFVSDSLDVRKSDSLVNNNDSLLPHKPSTIQIPVYDDVYASAGQGLLNEEYITRHIDMQRDFLRDYFGVANFLGLSIITARGDSMSPTIPENCQLLIQQSDSFQEGQICVVRLDNELYVKRLQKRPKYKLISDNKNYDDIELENEDYEILGVVVGFFKRMI